MNVFNIYLRVTGHGSAHSKGWKSPGEASVFTFKAMGHRHITARHPTTFEFTRETELTERGDCIVAVGAECGLSGLPSGIRDSMGTRGAVMEVIIRCGGIEEVVTGRGNPGLTYSNPTEMVGRKSGYVCGRTLMVHADMAAVDLDRELVGEVRKGGEVEVTLRVFRP